mmetsp:Transcript_29378/g.44365  ORF Transcript_29378/g.44365 Transcript_29378/m.44365 type:complete len:198 (+) Transcript_29378:1336-1929(+)
MSFQAHDCDVNVMSWNTNTTFLLASGDDNGEFKIWDLRKLKPTNQGSFDSITRIKWHTKPITSIQFEPREESVLAVASDDNKLTLWDFSVEVDEQELKQQREESGLEIPPQLMFMHQGQNLIKELRFHPQYRSTIFTTAMDSFNIFRPNLDPSYEPKEESKMDEDGTIKEAEYEQDSEEDQEEEERRIIETAKALNA